MRSAVLSLLLWIPGAVHADDIRVSSYEMNDTGGTIVLQSSAPIGEPSMRVYERSAKVWFPSILDIARFDHARDAKEPIRALQLRPGANDSAVLKIELGAGRKLTQENIDVQREGKSAVVRITLPAAPHLAAPAAADAPFAHAATLPAKSAMPTAAKPAAKISQPPAAAAEASALAAQTSQSAASTPTTPLLATKTEVPAKLELQKNTGSPNLALLIAISAALFIAYVVIKRKTRRSVARAPEIQVLSARRLGPRQELLVVRALGSDHLLLSSGGKVERVASVPTPAEPKLPGLLPPPPSAAAADEPDTQADGLGIIAKLSSASRVRRLLDAVEHEAAASGDAAAHAAAPNTRPQAFGPELLHAIHQHKLNQVASLPPLSGKQSEAVAGITRLRNTRAAN